jgi:Zn-dependent protease with chaperone function
MVILSSARSLLLKPYGFIKSLIHRFPRFYLGCVVLLALSGYAYVLLFPLLVPIGLLNIYEIFALGDIANWQAALTWSAVVLVAALVSYRITQIKPKTPVGLTLPEDKAPELFKLVQQHHAYFKRPEIHRIVITANYELDIIKTPMWALPVWSTNTMVIGLPVLQSLSKEQFECVIARRIGQFSKRYNTLTNWLYQLRAIWQQYRVIYRKQNGFGFQPLKWYFAVYAPLYKMVSLHAARLDELNADTYAMELYNHEVVLEMITADALCRWYLQNQFWPAVYKIASVEKKSLPAPHAKMASAVQTIKNGDKLDSLIDKVYKEKPRPGDAIPSLKDRVKNIGHDKPYMKKQTTGNAAESYLGTSHKGVIDVIDKLWLKSFLEQRKLQRQKKQKQVASEQVTSA